MRKYYSDEEVVTLYHDYQNSRTHQYSPSRRLILKALKIHLDKSEQQIKQEVMSQVMTILREKADTSVKSTHALDLPSKNFQRLFHLPIQGVRSALQKITRSTPAWQYTLPALALLAILFSILPQQNPTEYNHVSVAHNPYNELLQFSEQLAPTIQIVPTIGFGFSHANHSATNAFQLGIASIDLLILAQVNNRLAITDMLTQIQHTIPPAKQKGIEKYLDTIKASKETSTKDSFFSSSMQLAKLLESIPDESSEQALFAFGQWLETSLLASRINSNKDNAQILEQQRQNYTYTIKKLQQNMPQTSSPFPRLLSELNTIMNSNDEQAIKTKQLQQKLAQIKAFLHE